MNATSSESAPPRVFCWRAALFLFAAVLLLSLPQAVLIPLLDRDEPRFAEASREMLQSGNYVVPTFDGAPRYAKPPLIYWCQAACFSVFGQNAFAARLPSLLATAGTAVLLFAWGAHLASSRAGLGAALAYAFCLQTIQQGRVATADSLLIFFMTLTAFIGWKLLNPPPKCLASRAYFWGVLLALSVAGGFLAKGPEALLPIIALLICARSGPRGVIFNVVTSTILGLVLVGFWGIPAYYLTHGDYWRVGLSEGIGQRAISGLQGHGASNIGGYIMWLPYYLVLFWFSALPWSPLLLFHHRKFFPAWAADTSDRYLIINAALIFAVFTLMVTKLPHYSLPAFPLLALFLAKRIHEVNLPSRLLIRLGWAFSIGLALITLIIVPLALSHGATPSPTGVLVHEASDWLEGGTQFALVDFKEPNAIWDLRRVCTSYGDPISEADVLGYLQKPGPRAVVLTSAAWDRIRADKDPGWKIYQARGWNTAKGWDSKRGGLAFIDLTLVIK